MQLKLIISDARHFFMGNAVQIARICVPWLLASALVEYTMASIYQTSESVGPLYMLSWVFSLLVYPIYTGALILLMAARAKQEQPENRQLIAAAVKIWQPLFIVHMIGAGLTAVGLMFFVVPGVFIAVRLSFAEFYMVLENIKPLEALQKSFEATRPYFWLILIVLFIFITPLLGLSFLLANVLSDHGAGMLFNIVISTATGFLMLFVDVVMFRVYMSATRENPA